MSFDLFPVGGLTSSVVTAVWVGVFIVVTLNLRFGTTLSGLVIPGYLVPLMFIKPISAGVVIVEGVVTYLIAIVLARFVMVRLGYSELFGRDRFFALIVISVLVRIIFDYWALPHAGAWMVEQGLQFDYRNHLQSFGLIIVALIANQLWNSGLKSGSSILALYLLLTYLAIKYILIPFTNFNIAEIGYMYENLAQSLLASPKAYIILITTAFIASRMNLFYGWEFNGILIPSLLALQWYQPEKLLFTFIETAIILGLGFTVVRLPWLRNISFEGSRLFLLFFNIAFIYKIILGYALIAYFPTLKITDFYGFGYLVSTLLAIKMYQKNIAIQMTRATLQTSIIAVFIASIISFALTLIPRHEVNISSQITVEQKAQTAKSLQKFYTDFRPALFSSATVDYHEPLEIELQIFSEAWVVLKQYAKDRAEYQLTQASNLLERIGFSVQLLEQQYLLVTDQQPLRGWGLYVLNLQASDQLVLQVPDGLTEKYTDVAAMRMFEYFQARAIVISTSKRKRSDSGISDVLEYPVTLFQAFHNIIAENNVLQLRGYNREFNRLLLEQKNILWTKKRLPEDLHLAELNLWLKQLDVRFTPAPFNNLQRDSSLFGFAEMLITPAGIKRLLANVIPDKVISETQKPQRIEGYLQSWLLENKSMVARRSSESYQLPKLNELLFWDEEILIPLLDLVQSQKQSGWSEINQQELNRLGNIVSAYNYQLTHYIETGMSREYLMLTENPGENMRHWGTLVIRLGEGSDYLIEVPHPLSELSSFEFGVTWFAHLNAQYLLLSGSHPRANESGFASMSKAGNSGTVFQLIHQVLLREQKNTELLPVQIRIFSDKPGRPSPVQDVQLSFWQQIGIPEQPTSAGLLYQKLLDSGLSVSLFDGSHQASPYDAGYSQQSFYSPLSASRAFATIWLSSQLQYRFKHKASGSIVSQQARGLAIESKAVDVKGWLSRLKPSAVLIDQQVQTLLTDYQQQLSILQLSQLINYYPENRLKLLLDLDSGQEFILLLDTSDQWQVLFNPNALKANSVIFSGPQSIIDFINQRDSILRVID